MDGKGYKSCHIEESYLYWKRNDWRAEKYRDKSAPSPEYILDEIVRIVAWVRREHSKGKALEQKYNWKQSYGNAE